MDKKYISKDVYCYGQKTLDKQVFYYKERKLKSVVLNSKKAKDISQYNFILSEVYELKNIYDDYINCHNTIQENLHNVKTLNSLFEIFCIRYGRIFGSSNGFIKFKYGEIFEKTEYAMHKKLILLRNKVVAHNDLVNTYAILLIDEQNERQPTIIPGADKKVDIYKNQNYSILLDKLEIFISDIIKKNTNQLFEEYFHSNKDINKT